MYDLYRNGNSDKAVQRFVHLILRSAQRNVKLNYELCFILFPTNMNSILCTQSCCWCLRFISRSSICIWRSVAWYLKQYSVYLKWYCYYLLKNSIHGELYYFFLLYCSSSSYCAFDIFSFIVCNYILVIIYNIVVQHLRHYHQPNLQKYVVRILWMVRIIVLSVFVYLGTLLLHFFNLWYYCFP